MKPSRRGRNENGGTEAALHRAYEIVLLDELVPQDHLLRKVDRAVDFSFIHDLCKPLYAENIGRPAVEPELLFRMLLLGYLYGIKSEVKLAEAVNENIAFKWFLRLRLTEKGPDHATISANRVRRFRDNDIAEQIFFGFVHSQWQTGDCFRDSPDTSVDRGKLDRGVCVDRFSRTAGTEVEGWCGADAVLGLIPRTEQTGERILHAVPSIKRRAVRLPGWPSVYFSTIPLYMMFSHESSHRLDNLRWRAVMTCGIMCSAFEGFVGLTFSCADLFTVFYLIIKIVIQCLGVLHRCRAALSLSFALMNYSLTSIVRQTCNQLQSR